MLVPDPSDTARHPLVSYEEAERFAPDQQKDFDKLLTESLIFNNV